jgi:anti-sigma factor (TIGR02949 family)
MNLGSAGFGESLRSIVPGTRSWRARRDRKLCAQTLDHVQEIVDGELPAGKAKDLRRHLEACERCGDEATVARLMKQAICRVSGQADAETVRRLEELGRRLCEGQAPPE